MKDLPFAELWKAHNPQSLEESLCFWERRADEFNEITHCKDTAEREELIAYLAGGGALQPDFSVLDLGCGAGRYALEFCRRVRRVRGVDISPRMIAHAERNAAEAGLSNVSFSALAWQNADIDALGWRGAFDLVFASMSPAVDSEESLLKMCAASSAFCFMNGFIQRSDSLLRELAARLAPGHDVPPLDGSIIYAFNVLWRHGLHADVTCKETGWTNTWDIPTALVEYRLALARALPGAGDMDAAIERELTALAVNGKVTRHMRAKVAWLFWRTGG